MLGGCLITMGGGLHALDPRKGCGLQCWAPNGRGFAPFQVFRVPQNQYLRLQVSLMNCKQGYGMVALHTATQEAISKAQERGAGAVGLNNFSTSTGALG